MLQPQLSLVILRKALCVLQDRPEKRNRLVTQPQFLLTILSCMGEPGLHHALFGKIATLLFNRGESALADRANAWIVNKPVEGIINGQIRLGGNERPPTTQCDLVTNLGDHCCLSSAGRALNKQEIGGWREMSAYPIPVIDELVMDAVGLRIS